MPLPIQLYGDNPFLVRLLLESGRFLVHLTIMLLHAAHDPDRRETWCTVGLLKRHIVGHGVASERQVSHLIARLLTVGFVRVEPAREDRRIRLLVPTETMLAHDRRWLAAHYAPLTIIWPDRDYRAAIEGDPDYQLRHRREALTLMEAAMRIMMSVPETMLFFNRAGGHMVRSALLLAAMAQPDAPYVTVPYTELGRRFGLSRTHVRQILFAAEEAGLVKLIGRGGRSVELMPALWSSFDHGIAGGIYLHALVHQAVI
jgi:DNA-binding transcriptional ArsR family regulator